MTSKVIVREVKLLESFKLSDQFWNLTGETITWQIKYSEDTLNFYKLKFQSFPRHFYGIGKNIGKAIVIVWCHVNYILIRVET